ncbi:MAG: hypothetical protein KDB01_08225 [Planctomycetaceae bacterium]|nr:hypothetical protein [Planctomycetaceae bacterium]
MNSESPFRTSSMVLTIACVLCGITAGAYCVSRFTLARTADDSSELAVNLQYLNFVEFQQDVRSSHPHGERGFDVAPRSQSLPEHDSRLRKSGSIENSETQRAVSSRVGDGSASQTGETLFRSTGFARSSIPSSPPEDAVPHFYAPVTVHPVTVNIDNSAIIREIARLHERLDAVTEFSQTVDVFESTADSIAESIPPSASAVPAATRRFEYIVHSQNHKNTEVSPESSCEVPPDPEAASEAKCESRSEMAPQQATVPQPALAPEPKSLPQRLPARVSKERPQPGGPAASAAEAPERIFEVMPAPTPVLLFPEPVLTPTPTQEPTPEPEPTIEIIPQQPAPVIEFDDPSEVKPQTELPMIVPSIEFSTELMPVPGSISNPVPAVRQEYFEASTPAAQATTIERTAYCAPVKQSRRSASPESEVYLTPCYETAKRTTNPPFMNGARLDHLPIMDQATPEPRTPVTQASHVVREKNSEVPLSKVPPSNMPPAKAPPSGVSPHEVQRPKCRTCNAAPTPTPTYRIQAMTPPPILKRLTSLIRQEPVVK